MLRAICIIRTSTVQQEIESQRKEILIHAKEFGYTDEEIIVIGGAGASAIKLDDKYKENLAKVYSTIENNQIECVFAWAIDRIGRDEVTLYSFKNYLIDKGVNLVIKEPSLKLLNEDGSINGGVEIAMALFIQLAKEEMRQKKARFKRAKARNKEQGRFNGGAIKFGYALDENNRYILDPTNSEIIKEIFRLYSSGKYSTNTLLEELKTRGINIANKSRLRQILVDKAYIGEGTNITPVIISKEQFNRVQEILLNNKIAFPKQQGKKYVFGNKILKCKECGTNFIQQGHSYRCFGRQTDKNKCNNTVSPRADIVDGILWKIALFEHLDYVTNNTEDNIRDIEEQIAELEIKLAQKEHIDGKYKVKFQRLQDGYENEIYTEDQYHKKIQKIREEKREETIKFKELEERLIKLNEELYNLTHGTEDRLLNTILNEIDNPIIASKDIYDIIRKHIKVVYVSNYECETERAVYQFEIILNRNVTYNLLYYPYRKENKVVDMESGKPFSIDKVEHHTDGTITLTNIETINYRNKFVEAIKTEHKDIFEDLTHRPIPTDKDLVLHHAKQVLEIKQYLKENGLNHLLDNETDI